MPCRTRAAGRSSWPLCAKRQRAREQPGEIAGVISWTDRRLVRHRARRDQVAATDLGAVEAELVGRTVGETFQHIAGLRPAGAAVGIGWDRVGEHADALDADRRRAIDAGQQRAVDRAWNSRAERRDVRAEIGKRVDAQRQKMTVRVECELCLGGMVAALVVGDEALGSGRNPTHRALQSARCEGHD
jgi:hypothetical protein